MSTKSPEAFTLQQIVVDNCKNNQVTPRNLSQDPTHLTQEEIILRFNQLAQMLNAYGAHFNEYYCGKNNTASISFVSLANGIGHFTCQNTICPFRN